MLPFHEHLVTELLQEDAVVVMAAGLGLSKVLAALLRLHSASDGIFFLLSMSDSQRQALREELQEQDSKAELPVEINNEYTGSERLTCYTAGGSFFVTSRILIVDMLNERVPLQRVAGIIVNNAHRITESCAEAFIVRLYRIANKSGFIRAFSDRAQGMRLGFLRTERIMKSLFVKKLLLWPRFHLSVTTALEANPPEVVDIRVPMTSYMMGIQSAIVEVMDACLKELRKTNKIDVEDLTVENGLFKSFDEIIKRQLDPIWHTLGRKTKQLVRDLKTLRELADYLVRYDAVTFLRYLDTVRASEGVRSVWIFAPPTHKIFDLAKRRVYQTVRVDKGLLLTSAGSSRFNLKPGRGRRGSQGQGRGKDLPFAVVEAECHGHKRKRDDIGRMNSDRMESKSADVELNLDSVDSKTFEAHAGDKDAAKKGTDRTSASEEGKLPGDAGVVLEVVLEEMPKWKVLREILEEIQEERSQEPSCSTTEQLSQSSVDAGSVVLVACKDERTCLQLQNSVVEAPSQLMQAEWNKYLLEKAELHGMRTRSLKRNNNAKGFGILNGRAPKANKAAGCLNNSHSLEQNALLVAAAEVAREVIEVDNESAQRVTRSCGRGGRSKQVDDDTGSDKRKSRRKGGHQGKRLANSKDLANEDGDTLVKEQSSSKMKASGAMPPEKSTAEDGPHLVMKQGDMKIAAEEVHPRKPIPLVHFYALESEPSILEVLRPSFIVVYDPDMNFVREMEVYKAEHPARPMKVYFLFYENSTEAQKFEASIQKENDAFESLIRQKASMMISVDQDVQILDGSPVSQSATGVALNISSRKAGGRKAPEKQMQIIVDMREFSSSLPCVLHQQGIRILPVTLEVGDYVLSPDICIERKSVADLISSFASGRLYHQAETMTRYYKLPVLLIEFSQDKTFSLQSANDVGDEIFSANIVSRMSLLVLHFPRLRIVWSRSLHATADIFATLKANQDEADVEKAMRVGVPTEDGLIEGDLRAENYNSTAVELLRRLPGVTDANYRSLMDGCKSLAELALFSLEELAKLMGGQRPARMLRDFLDAKCPTLT
ncbi:hypothetical protein O6H91_09G067800 [Diphasiastrum complanatum]|uniref:Uncharacterized protein n=1 Tax=Diphasiastrum complanatum TaxID=34168 RepID=A0ACC2CQE0_DIPCM|nr:hypothetical protein O6H91_09G067800 [Diphasiastrum complanatum]